jgi:hypothetical protein
MSKRIAWSLMADADRKEQIKQAVISAFAEVTYPGGEHVALQPETFEGEELDQDFKGQHWRDMAPEALKRHVVIFFRPEARQFYLPAFLLAALDRLPAGRVDLDVYVLKPPEDETRFRQEYDAYTRAQREAIRLFLEYAGDEASDRNTKRVARLALERYWARAAQNPQSGAQDEPRVTEEPARKMLVRQAIREAFAEVPYPGDKAIAYKPDDWEGKDINLDFSGYHWRELPHAVVSYHYLALSLLSAKGMQFYLPAYIMTGLDGDSNMLGWTVTHLAPLRGNADEDFKSQYVGFTPAQRHAIRLFLEYVRDSKPEAAGCEEEAQEALDKYWGRDAPEQPAG